MIVVIIIGFIILIVYVLRTMDSTEYRIVKPKNTSKKLTAIPSYKNSNSTNTSNKGDQLNPNLLRENMTANLKIVDNIRIKYRALSKIIEVTYKAKVCPKCNERKMDFTNVAPKGHFIICQCSNCSKLQTFNIIPGKNGLEVIKRFDEIKQLVESYKLPVDEAFWMTEIDISFIVNTESDTRLKGQDKFGNEFNYSNYENWYLGSKYKTELNLNSEEVYLLNKLEYPRNNFCSVEYCCIEIISVAL